MEKILGILVCRKWGHFKAVHQAKSDRAEVSFPIPLNAACRTDCLLPEGHAWGGAPAQGCSAPSQTRCNASLVSFCARCVLAFCCERGQVPHKLSWLSHRSSFHWNPVISVSDFYFVGEKCEGFSTRWEDHRRTGWGFVLRLRMTDTWMLHIQIKKLSKESVKKTPNPTSVDLHNLVNKSDLIWRFQPLAAMELMGDWTTIILSRLVKCSCQKLVFWEHRSVQQRYGNK